jgi:GR25 family glycosyltransferase involved in LPS biosynthesis
MKSFIIHLSKIESSLTSALEVKSALDKFNMDAELFEGSYGSTIKEKYTKDKRSWHPWGFKGRDKPYSDDDRKMLWGIPGEMGCFDSHYRLWQRCIELNEPILIFEDDVELVRPYIPVEWEDVLSVAFSHTKKMPKYQHYLDTPAGDPCAADYGQASMPGNGGYAIKPHAAKILVEEYKNTYLPADNAINQTLVKIQIHNYMMGKARSKHEGNISLIRTKIWNTDERNI